jgi:hypothetical protein
LHRVAVAAFGFDFGAAPPLNRFINPKDGLPFRLESGDQQAEQDLANWQNGPSRLIQDSMMVLKMNLLTCAHHAQASCDGAFASGK